MHLIVYIQRSKQCRRCRRYAADLNALIAMYVEDIKDGVCSFYTYRVTHFVTHVEGVEGVKYYE